MAELTKTQEKKIENEVKKRLHEKLRGGAVSSTKAFREEFKKQTVIAITAAFAFLIALSWRSPIQNSVDKIVSRLGLSEQIIYYEYLTAVIITILAVLALMIISKWASEKK